MSELIFTSSVPFKAGDIVTALIDLSDGGDDLRSRPFTITGTVYAVPQLPGTLWVGQSIIVQLNEVLPWVTVAVIAPAELHALEGSL